MTYVEQLRQPEWEVRRLEVLKLANYTCVRCGAKGVTLNAHHKYYEKGRMAWEYTNEAFECLCEHCHEIEHIPDCCHTPYFQSTYDIDARAKILVPVSAKFCPVCGKEIERA